MIKPGTITEGKPKVTDIISFMDEKEFLKKAAGIESKSEHPLAKAIVKKAKEEEIVYEEIEEFKAIPGKGVTGKINGKNFYAGSESFIQENEVNTENENSDKLQKQGKTVLYFAENKELIGIIAVADVIKRTSNLAVSQLKNRKIETIMITGDNETVANYIAKEANINTVVAEVLPQDKAKEVKNLQNDKHKVAFIGDGINDSPALAQADVGIAIGSGTDIALDSADVVLMKNDLQDSVTAIDLSKEVIKNIKQNLFWAFFYNIIGIPIACGLLYPTFGIRLNPMIGAAAMSLSSVCVVSNALRLRNFKPRNKKEVKTKMDTITIQIEGMMCNHCKMAVENALKSVEGITNVDVSLENKTATIETNKKVESDTIKEAIEKAGYKVI